MTNVLRGVKKYGTFTIGTNTPIAQRVAGFPLFNAFALEKSVEEETVRAFVNGSPDGALQTFATFVSSEEFELTFTMPGFSWFQLQQLIGEFASTTASLVWQQPKKGVVNSSGELIDAAILATTPIASIQATIAAKGSWGEMRPLKLITTGTPTADEALIASGKLTLNSSNANAPIDYAIATTETDIETIGIEPNPKSFDDLSFVGLLGLTGTAANEGILFRVPQMQKSGGFSLGTGDSNETEITYKPSVKAGNRSAIEFALVTV